MVIKDRGYAPVILPSKNPPTGALDRDLFLASKFFLPSTDGSRISPNSSNGSSSGLWPVCLKFTFANSGISADAAV